MNVKIGTEAEQFPEKDYINGIFLAVHLTQIPAAERRVGGTSFLIFRTRREASETICTRD
jgi:hypothetical protein